MKKTGIIIATLLATASIASADIVGKAVTVHSKIISMTSDQLMARERVYGPKLPIRKLKDYETEHEYDRSHLRQNPSSPASATWPPMLNDAPIRTNNGGKNNGPPLFSVPVNFGGPTLGESGFVPPDSDGDVSLSSVIVAANGRIKSYDRLGNLGTLNLDTSVFFSSLTPVGGTSDPRVVFDRLSNRWYVEILDLAGTNNRLLLAVSDTEAITGSTVWKFFAFAQNIGAGPSGFADYATLGVDANGVYIGTNRFNGSFQNCDLFAIDKASLLLAVPVLTVTPFHSVIAGTGTGMFTPWPCSNDDPTATVAFVVGVDNAIFGSLDYRRISFAAGVFSLSANTALTVPATSVPFQMPISTGAASTGSIDSLDDRLFYARVCRNRLTGAVTVHTAHGISTDAAGVSGAGNSRSSARWYNIGNVFSGAATLTASGTVVDGTGAGFKYCTIPSTAMNGQGHQFVGFTLGNTSNSPGVGGAYRLSSDPLVTAPTGIQAGVNFYNVQSGTPTGKRWGDYSFTMVDPRDMMSIWSFQEYCNANNSWQVRAIKVLAPAPTVTSLTPNNGTQGQTMNVVVAGTGIFDPDVTYPDHLAFSFGANITVNTVTWNSATQATVNITIGGAAATGSRTITLTNPDAQTATSAFTVNLGVKTVSGTISIQGYVGPNVLTPANFVFEIRDAGTNAFIENPGSVTYSLGAFTFTTNQPAGSYKLRIRGVNRFLASSQPITLTASGATGLAYSLTNGDASADNIVGVADFNLLRAAWGGVAPSAPYSEAADFNGDGIVGVADFNIMRASWGAIGDN